MRGRKPLPSAIRLATGNPGKRPINAREPKPVTSIPTCPAHLMPTAKAEWKRVARYLHDLGVISELDRAALAAYCQAYKDRLNTATSIVSVSASLSGRRRSGSCGDFHLRPEPSQRLERRG